MYIIIDMILKIFNLYTILILLNILGTWIDPYNQISIFQWIRKFTDPYFKIFRIIIPIGNINLDIS
ncbi:YggT family protein [Leptotrichia massiliensis]